MKNLYIRLTIDVICWVGAVLLLLHYDHNAIAAGAAAFAILYFTWAARVLLRVHRIRKLLEKHRGED